MSLAGNEGANALAQEIAAIIAQEGPISVEHYMSLCLGHPTLGYYMEREPFGAAGDFTTAPEISQMFGELLGVWAAEVWAICGAPKPARLTELGPGRGVLMADALRAARVAPDFYASVDVTMVETSPGLTELQRAALAESDCPVAWKESVGDIAYPTIILANEFFDALAVRHYVRKDGFWRERLVGLDEEGRFMFGAAGAPEPYLHVAASEGSIIEVGVIGQRIMTEIATNIVAHGGVLLLIDYGYTQTALGETLQAVRNHAFVDPLEQPGEADMTAHVDFAALRRAALAAGARVHGPVAQGAFLRNIGIGARADGLIQKATPEQAAEVESGLLRLVAQDQPSDMGVLFKVMAVTSSSIDVLPGFAPEEVV